MKATWFVLVGVVLAIAMPAGATLLRGEMYTSGVHRFEMQPPEGDWSAAPAHPIAKFYLPPTDNFTANINVVRESFSGTLEDYEKKAVPMLEKELKAKLLKKEQKPGELLIEYTAKMEGRDLHFIARIVKRDDAAYVVTGTSLANDWEKQKEAITKSVMTFRLRD